MAFKVSNCDHGLGKISEFFNCDEEVLKKLAGERLFFPNKRPKEKRALKTWETEGILGIDTVCHRDQIKTVFNWCNRTPTLPGLKVHQIYPFLKTVRFHRKKCYQLIKRYYEFRYKMLDVFENRNPYSDRVQSVWKILNLAPVLGFTSNNALVIYVSLKLRNPEQFHLIDSVRLFLMAIEVCNMQIVVPQAYEFVVDASNLRTYHMAYEHRKFIKTFIRFLQKAIPINVRAIHVIRNSKRSLFVCRSLLAMTEKSFWRKVFFYMGEDLQSLYAVLPQKYLPCELRGKKASIRYYEVILRQKLEDLWGWFEEEELSWTRLVYHISSASSIAPNTITTQCLSTPVLSNSPKRSFSASEEEEEEKEEEDEEKEEDEDDSSQLNTNTVVNQIIEDLLKAVLEEVYTYLILQCIPNSLEKNFSKTIKRIKKFHAKNAQKKQARCPDSMKAVDYMTELNTLHQQCYRLDVTFV